MSNKAETTGFIIIQIYLSGRSLKKTKKKASHYPDVILQKKKKKKLSRFGE